MSASSSDSPTGVSRFLAAWAALLPSVDDPRQREELAASRSKQRSREASSSRAAVTLLVGSALLCDVPKMVEGEHATTTAVVAAVLEPTIAIAWLVALHRAPRRFWVHLCVFVHAWALFNGCYMVAIMVLDGCADIPEQAGFFSVAEYVCRYTRVGLVPSWVPIYAVLVPTFLVVILDQLSFRTNAAVLLTELLLYMTATYGMLGKSVESVNFHGMVSVVPVASASPHAVRFIWFDFLTMFLLIWSFERAQRFDALESMAKEQQVVEEQMLAALLCHEIKNPLNVVNFFLGVLEDEQQQQQQQHQQQQQEQQEQKGLEAGEADEAGEGSDSGSAPSTLREALQQAAQAAQAAGASEGRWGPASEGGTAATDCSRFLGRQRALLHLLPGAIHCTKVMVDLVESCRHLAKVDSGTYAPQEEEINLRQIAESCLGVFGREREAGLVFDLHCPAELAIVSDRLLWRRVLMNLIGNAVKFTMHDIYGSPLPLPLPPWHCARMDLRHYEQPRERVSPRVAVRIERDQHDPGKLRVEVSDNGPGIGAADQALIFSSGLGLHLSAKIVQVLHGQLDLTSPLQVGGRGTRFGAYASRTRASPACNPHLTPRPRPCDCPRLQTSPCPAHSCTRSSREAARVACPLTPCP